MPMKTATGRRGPSFAAEMLSSRKNKSVVGLDIEAGSIAATEVVANGATNVSATGIAPLPPGIFREGEVTDHDGLAEAIKELFAREKLGKSVRVGIANQRVVVRTLRLPPIDDPAELEAAIRFQAQDHIPMPLDQAVLDYQVVGGSAGEAGESRIDVVAVAARRDMVEAVLRALDGAGLRPVGMDLAAFGMIRALAPEMSAGADAVPYEERLGQNGEDVQIEPLASAHLYCNLGDVTNLAVARGSTCFFTRISPFGVEGIAQRLAERRALTLEHARQWLVHVGLDKPTDQIDGDPEIVAAAREALAEGAGRLANELRLSVEFYGTQEGALPVEGVVACGPGTTIPGLVERLQRELGYAFAVGRPRALVHLDQAEAARLILPYGLALET